MVLTWGLLACAEDEGVRERWADTLDRLAADVEASGSCPTPSDVDLGERTLLDNLDAQTSVDRNVYITSIFLGFEGNQAPCYYDWEPPRGYGQIIGEEMVALPALTPVTYAEIRYEEEYSWGHAEEFKGWVCLESLQPDAPEATRPGPGVAVGTWLMRYDDVALFGSFTEASCVVGEDAGVWSHEETGTMHNGQCNGIDDDFDGLIDEGAQDCNGDGVADCLQGIEATPEC